MTWNINKINQHIENGIEESIHLDYKQFASLQKTDPCKAELSKDVSSFANSDGGIIIYGIKELNHKPISIDDTKISPGITKEWIEDVIESNIFPKIDGLKIHPIDDLVNNIQLFVIDIPKSNRAPHMAKDKKYYKRYNFKSQPMEHYEIEDLRIREGGPEIIGKIRVGMNGRIEYKSKKPGFTCTGLSIWLENINQNLAENYCVVLYLPEEIAIYNCDWKFIGDRPSYIGAKLIFANLFTKTFCLNNSTPLWQGIEQNVMNENCIIEYDISSNHDLNFYIKVFAHRMRPRHFRMQIIGNKSGSAFNYFDDAPIL